MTWLLVSIIAGLVSLQGLLGILLWKTLSRERAASGGLQNLKETLNLQAEQIKGLTFLKDANLGVVTGLETQVRVLTQQRDALAKLVPAGSSINDALSRLEGSQR